MSRNLRKQFAFLGKILNKVIEIDENVKMSSSFTILLNRMVTFTINLLDHSNLFQGCQAHRLPKKMSKYPHPGIILECVHFFPH